MASLPAIATVISSATLRFLSYIFFRWIPGHQLPPIIYTAAAVYLTSFILVTAISLSTVVAQVGEPQANGAHPAKELEVRDTRRNEESVGVAQTLLLGRPSSRPSLWNLTTLLVNIVLLLGVLDVVYRGPMLHPAHDLSFARVGFVSDTSAKVLVREPSGTQLPVYLSYREATAPGAEPFDVARKAAGAVYGLSNDTDYTQTFTISKLRPMTTYQYAVSNNHTGYFATAAPVGQTQGGKFTFLTSSCIKPRFPYNPWTHPLSIPGLKHLAEWIPSLHASFMLFLGDFIYIDVPHRFGNDAETYRREYRQVYASPDWPAVSIPWLHVIDDHEIANDWDANTTAPFPSAIDPWDIYHASLNPPPALPNVSYFQFSQGPASFFMMETRRYRDPEQASPATSPTKSMLGKTQLTSLLHFLRRDEPVGIKWKFVISSIPFTRNWRVNSADTWSNYLHERRIILEAMWDVGLRGEGIGVVVLSGDRHEFAATAFPPPQDSKWPLSATVHEFSTSPLSMFYLPVRTYWEVEGEDEEEVCVKYLPDGNSKFGAVELEEVKGGEQGLMRFRLFVDGAERWEYVLMTPPAVGGGGRGKDAVWG